MLVIVKEDIMLSFYIAYLWDKKAFFSQNINKRIEK